MSWLVNSIKGAFGFGDLEVVQAGDGESGKEHSAPTEEKQGLWKQLSGFIGKDVTSMISLPIWLFEPLSFMQVLAEPMQYAELLFKASEAADPTIRLAYLSAWIVAGYSCAQRTKKPFNPHLGETYEFISPDKRFKIFGEQVSHHPPISVVQIIAEGQFTLVLEMELHTKFKGNSSDVFVHGSNRITFDKFDETIYWGHMDTTANNVIIGGMWLDHYGEVTLKGKTGARAVAKMTQSGWLGSGRYDTTTECFDEAGKLKLKLTGKWNDVINATKYDEAGNAADPITLWKKPAKKPDNKWGFTQFTESLSAMDDEYQAILPPTDSRFRQDRYQLEKDNMELAGKEKHRLEEEQRAIRRAREAAGEVWTPKYFQKVDDAEWQHRYEYVGNYWEERELRIKKVAAGIVDESAEAIATLSVDGKSEADA
eukprot:TRINITY_DN19105_c0_g1_i1.p1 TRINITY_DN19105_c0_g1~~TRINITY_DN19105_c0_g1_i1.p1  ORF type:complete len:425 (+),score=51.86 TRINITY_DN19105_c0_g1_i1:153-1427(+)